MVIENFNQHDSHSNESLFRKHRVSIFRRLFSALLDYFILSPIVFFVSMTLLRNGIELFKQFPESSEAKEVIFHVCLLSLTLFAFIQSIFIYYFKGTPGQLIVKIQNEFAPSNYSRFLQILIRQIGFVSTPLLMGIPWLAIIYHPEGKAFYERLSEGHLYSLVPFEFELIKDGERKYIGLSLSTASYFVIFLMVIQWWTNYQSLLNLPIPEHTAHLMDQNGCEQVKSSNPISKLQILIAMNLVNIVSDECLNFQLDHDLWKNFSAETDEIHSLAYFGKFVTAQSKELENVYLKHACESSDEFEGCHLSKNIERVDALKDVYYNSPLIAVIKYENGKGDLATLKSWNHVRMVKKYILSEKVLSLDVAKSIVKGKSQKREPASEKKSLTSEQIKDLARELRDL